MAINLKKLFTNASQNTANFYNNLLMPGQKYPGKDDPTLDEGDVGSEEVKTGSITRGINRALSKVGLKVLPKSKTGSSGYGKSVEAYNAYLNTLRMLKVGTRRLPGRVGGTGVVTPGQAGRAGSILKPTSFENKLDEWNSRMRKFSVSRYYAQLGEK